MGNFNLIACGYCGANGETVLDRDHVVPRSRGGPDDATNIVMACKRCNAAKRDLTAVEWLGDRCPEEIREIESRVNEKLAKRFRQRDKKFNKRTEDVKLYACHVLPNGGVDYVGEVLEERGEVLRIEAIDGVMFFFGFWDLSGAIYDLPRSECRLFNDKGACVEDVVRRNRRPESQTE